MHPHCIQSKNLCFAWHEVRQSPASEADGLKADKGQPALFHRTASGWCCFTKPCMAMMTPLRAPTQATWAGTPRMSLSPSATLSQDC